MSEWPRAFQPQGVNLIQDGFELPFLGVPRISSGLASGSSARFSANTLLSGAVSTNRSSDVLISAVSAAFQQNYECV